MSDAVKNALADVAAAAVGLAGAYTVYMAGQLKEYIKKKTELIAGQAKADAFYHVLDQVDEIASKIVQKTEQTVAAELRSMVKAGTADRLQLLELGKKAVDDVVNTLGPDALQVLAAAMGDYKGYIESTVESKVRQLKQENQSLTV